ncbi:MAG: hypothetical protein XD40_0850 [Archaeoglobus fulgidus]|uniref:Outer membrane lipoprotein carrier protein LolA n=1 Tax=Archaeoglobus fulgidus TaxID=2234 RepID=A0A124FC38_ARCFL|nr:outer membrane lipoprotein carrier protein LolA [Archaeoglobus fulgidus]KUJ93922.1 MAG: hypothetical protein XD40_0850 [Archaeoglobus fulgidus]KUK07451.1 MAG: hypothetical protein XD48_0347 [Archaeoglobus fulgidus]
MKRVWPLIAALVFLSACIQTPTAEEILTKVYERYEEIESYKAKIQEVSDNHVTYINVAFKKPDKMRIEYLPENTVSVFNGSAVKICSGNGSKTITLNRIVDFYYGHFLEMLKSYEVTLVGEEKVVVNNESKECYVLAAKDGGKGEVEIEKVWVVKGEWYPAKIQLRVSFPENNTVTLHFVSMELDATLSDSLFEPCDL